MKERLWITVGPTRATRAAERPFLTFIDLWRIRGYVIDLYPLNDLVRVGIPLEDAVWRDEIDAAVAAGTVSNEWSKCSIDQIYTPDEVASAPLFWMVHMGRSIRFPMGKDNIAGVTHFMDVDDSKACLACGVGAVQSGPLRLPAAELNKAGRFGSLYIGDDTFFIISRTLGVAWREAVGEPLPLRGVDMIGAASPKEPWYQIDPTFILPDRILGEHRMTRSVCPTFGGLQVEGSPDVPSGGYFTANAALRDIALPPVLLSCFAGGELLRYADGQVKQIPTRQLLVRGDVGRALATFKVRGLDLIPIIWDNPTTVH